MMMKNGPHADHINVNTLAVVANYSFAKCGQFSKECNESISLFLPNLCVCTLISKIF